MNLNFHCDMTLSYILAYAYKYIALVNELKRLRCGNSISSS